LEGKLVEAKATMAEKLVFKCDRFVPARAPIQKSLQELATQTACAVFAVLLRHAVGSRKCVKLALVAASQDQQTPPPKLIARLWSKGTSCLPLCSSFVFKVKVAVFCCVSA
jgi:hypothetical protein